MNSYLLALFEPCEKKKQKHPSRGVQPYRPKSDFNKVAIFWYGCSPVNLLHIFRTPFPKNTSGRLLLNIVTEKVSIKDESYGCFNKLYLINKKIVPAYQFC